MRMPADNSTTFEITPAGTHIAVCYRVIDCGTQQGEFAGEINHKRKVMLSWELPEEKMEDGRPFSVHKIYTYSSHEKATLRQHLESWRGKAFNENDFGPEGFDISKLLGIGCMLGITHDNKTGTTYANISAICKLPKGTAAPALINPTVLLDLDGFDQATFDELSESMKSKIAKSPEYQEIVNGPSVPDVAVMGYDVGIDYDGNDLDDEIPF